MPGTIAKGTTLTLNAVVVDELVSINLPDQGAITEEDTTLDDTAERHSSVGVVMAGELTADVLLSDETHSALIALTAAHAKVVVLVTYPSGATHTGSAASVRLQITAQLKSFLRATLTCQLDGALVFAAAPP